MKMPVHCPVCQDIMVTSYDPDETILIKVCNKRVSHDISLFADVPTDQVYKVQVRISTNPVEYGVWVFTKKEFFVIAKLGKGNYLQLPYFEPDLSNYRKLVAKARTYILFS